MHAGKLRVKEVQPEPTTLERDPNFGRLDSDLEVAIFRVARECLTNVQRHSGSREVKVRLSRSLGNVRIEVQDWGRGLPEEKPLSIPKNGARGGLRGMRERILQLGGSLNVESSGQGTTVIVSFPDRENRLPPPLKSVGVPRTTE